VCPRPAVSGTPANVRAFADALRGFDKHFQKTDFKYIDELKADKAFKDLKIFPVAELVFYGMSSDKAVKLAETVGGGQHLEAQEYHKLMQQPDTVIVDVRNHYEAEIGRFVGQEKSGPCQPTLVPAAPRGSSPDAAACLSGYHCISTQREALRRRAPLGPPLRLRDCRPVSTTEPTKIFIFVEEDRRTLFILFYWETRSKCKFPNKLRKKKKYNNMC